MTAITNFTTLQSAVIQELEDNSSEFSLYLPIAIDLAEQRMSREVDTYGLLTTTTLTTTASDNLVTKPSNYRLPYQLVQILDDGSKNPLTKTTDEFINTYWTDASVTSEILKYYADFDNNSFILAPTPDDTYSLTLKYLSRPTPLSAANQTNYFTEKCVDALFYATLKEMCRWMRNFQLMDFYEQQYVNSVTGINNEGRRSRRDDERVPLNPNGGTNNLKEGSH